jgi:tRNA-specific 2-thiouridylase
MVEKRLKVLVAMSGGVDSAVAAHQLQAQGHEVAGATMKLFCYDKQEAPGHNRACCDLEAIREARRSADLLGIGHTVIDVEEAFGRDVVGNFVEEYAAARTPNPCVRCNTYVKFGPLLEKARRMGFDAIATGHYVDRRPVNGDENGWGLFRARDRTKDQSYVLWGLERDALGRCLFPLGTTQKPAVRRLARRLGLSSWDRPESQDICFVGPRQHPRFLADRLPPSHPMRRPGPVRNLEGDLLGTHEGLLGYTVGQRKGMGVAGGERLYVVRLDPETATLWVGAREAMRNGGLVASGGNLLAPERLLQGDGVTAKIRYRHHGIACRIRCLSDGSWEVRFLQPEPGVAPGQSVVFYCGERLLGGATITRGLPVDSGP